MKKAQQPCPQKRWRWQDSFLLLASQRNRKVDKTVILLNFFSFKFKVFDYPNSFILSVRDTYLSRHSLVTVSLIYSVYLSFIYPIGIYQLRYLKKLNWDIQSYLCLIHQTLFCRYSPKITIHSFHCSISLTKELSHRFLIRLTQF